MTPGEHRRTGPPGKPLRNGESGTACSSDTGHHHQRPASTTQPDQLHLLILGGQQVPADSAASGALGTPSPVVSIHPRSEDGSTARTATGNQITCGRCPAWWTGLGSAHCVGCHESFTSVSAFDLHRRGGECRHPADVGLVPADKSWPGWQHPGTWGGPDDDADVHGAAEDS